jgi:hypothetical protein
MNNEKCVFCDREVLTRQHHIVPKSKGGKETVSACESCENYIHKTWTHNELRDIYNNVETILSNEGFQKFLKWLKKQQIGVVFYSDKNRNKPRGRYN